MRPAFAMSINKSQGQTFNNVGVYLPKPVFSRGQLYVALSRLGQRDGIKIMVKKDGRKEMTVDAPADVYTDNVVFCDVFRIKD